MLLFLKKIINNAVSSAKAKIQPKCRIPKRSNNNPSRVLKIISGILYEDGGEIIYPENSEIAMAFQYSALFDFLNVRHIE